MKAGRSLGPKCDGTWDSEAGPACASQQRCDMWGFCFSGSDVLCLKQQRGIPMADIEALRVKFAKYPKILAYLEVLAENDFNEGLERFAEMTINESDQTISIPDVPDESVPIDQINDFCEY